MRQRKVKSLNTVMLSLIPIGAENAISGKDLSGKIGKDVRALRADVHDARAAGYPILSDVTGYYMPATKQEADAFLGAWKRRMNSARVTTAPVRRVANR